MEPKYPDSVREVDIDKICSDSKFGELNFVAVIKPLEQMVADIVELEDYDFRSYLTQSEINPIDQARRQVFDYISQIQSFSITQPNSTDIRNNLIQGLQNYYQNSFAEQTRRSLLYLQHKARSAAKTNEAELERQAKELHTLIARVKEETEKFEKDKESIERGQGIISAKYLSQKFTEAGGIAMGESQRWQKWVFWLSIVLISVVILLFAGYVGYIKWIDQTGRIEYGILSSVLIASIFFYLKVVLRNYNITKHIEIGNKHRANVASTIEGLLAQATQDPDLKTALLKEGSTALFQTDSTGYLTKDQVEVSTPVKEVITTILNHK